MTDEPATRPGAPGRTRRVLAIALFALALAGCLTAITVALVSGMSFSAAVNAYTVTDGAMGLPSPSAACCWPGTGRATRSAGYSWPRAWAWPARPRPDRS